VTPDAPQAAGRVLVGTVTMNPSIDQHILIDRLVKDDALRARDIRRDPGGKGINVSRALKELGGETIAFGITGGGSGYVVKSLLHERGILFESVEVLEETRTNIILTDLSDRTQTRVSSPGPWVPLETADELITRVLRHPIAPRWWVLGGSLPRGIPTDFYARMIRALQAKGARCIVDADNDVLRIALEAAPFGIKPNESELARLVGRELHGDADVLEAARDVIAHGVQLVAVTLGAGGALVVTRDRAVRSLAPKVEVKSKVGAGDSFLAGLVLGLGRGYSLEEATRLGTAAGTAAVVHEGTQLCRRDDVERLLMSVRLESRELEPRVEPSKKSSGIRDVVCGAGLDPAIVSFRAHHRGRSYRFCSLACQKLFEERPDRYVLLSDELAREAG
jgi:6-phosphofructokinase 2